MAEQNLMAILLSGATGALGTAALNYAVRIRLEKRRRSDDEKRAARVYLTQVARVLAMGAVCKIIGDTYAAAVKEAAKDFSKKHTTEAEAAHLIIATIFHFVRKPDWDKSELNNFLFHWDLMQAYMDEVFDFRIPIDSLCRFPSGTIAAYTNFVDATVNARHATHLLTAFLKGDEAITEVDLYMVWAYAKLLYEHAERLVEALRRYGEISKAETERILAELKAAQAEVVMERTNAEPKLKAVMAAFSKEESKKSNTKR